MERKLDNNNGNQTRPDQCTTLCGEAGTGAGAGTKVVNGLVLLYSPTATYGEHNVVRVMFRFSFHKLNAGRVLPMTHGLLEQSLVQSTEVAIDFIGYHSVVPDSFLLSRYSSGQATMFTHKTKLTESGKRFVTLNGVPNG